MLRSMRAASCWRNTRTSSARITRVLVRSSTEIADVALPKASLTYKVFLGTAFVVAAVLGTSLFLASRSANRTAVDAIQRALEGTREQVQSMLSDRDRLNSVGARVFV